MKSIKGRLDRIERRHEDGRVVIRVQIDTGDLPDPKPGERVIYVRPAQDGEQS